MPEVLNNDPATPVRDAEPTPRTDTSPEGLVRVLSRAQLGRFSGVLIFVAVFATFAIWTPDTFLTETTWKSVLSTQAITAILAIGLLFPLAAGVFDLSAAQLLGFSALVCGALMFHEPHMSPGLAIVATLGVGLLVGVFNGFLVAGVGVDSFIATLGTSSLLIAFAQLIGGGDYLGPFSSGFTNLTDGEVVGVPIVVLYLLVFAVIAWYALEHTPLGRRVYATGANSDASRLAGIRTKRFVFWTLIFSSVVASLAGVLLASNLNSVNETLGPQYLLPAFAAAFLGSTQLKPGRFNVWGTILAIYLLGMGVQGIQLVGGELWVTSLFNGLALIVAVSAVLVLERVRRWREKAKTARATPA
jgi:ribose transport system permease protein